MLSFAQLLWLQVIAWSAKSCVEAAHVKFDFQKKSTAIHGHVRRSNYFQVALPDGEIHYQVNVSMGTPPQYVSLSFDTGSSNVWTFGASSKACQNNSCNSVGDFNQSRSSTYRLLSQGDFSVSYAAGTAGGDYFSDTFNIGGVDISNLTMGLALKSTSGFGGTGVLGLGLDSLQMQAQSGTGPEVPGVLDGLVKSGAISRRAFSLYLDDQEAGIGSVLFGGIDTSKYQGDLVSVAMAPNSTGQYDRYRLDLTSVSLKDAAGKTTLLSPSNMSAPSILDAGSPSLSLSSQLTSAIVKGIGAIDFQGNYFADCAYSNSNASFNFQFGGGAGPSISMPINQLLTPPVGVEFANGAQACALLLTLASETESDLSALGGYTLGDPLLRNAYLVFDTDNLEIAMAQAVYNKTGNGTITEISSGSGLPGVSSTFTAMPTAVPTISQASLSMSSNATSSAGSSPTQAAETTSIPTTPPSPTFDLGTATAAAQPSTSTASSGAASSLPISRDAGTLVSVLVSLVTVALWWL